LNTQTLGTLRDFWKNKGKMELRPPSAFALIVNEFANGSIARRAWAAIFETSDLLQILAIDLINVPYLVMRASTAGAEQGPIIRALAYVILTSLHKMPAEDIAQVVMSFISRDDEQLSEELLEMLLMPIMDQMLSEIQDVCSSDCSRIVNIGRKVLENEDQVAEYWMRFERNETERNEPDLTFRLENTRAPCKIGFRVDENSGCPLFRTEPSVHNAAELLRILKRVTAFRRREARENRQRKAAERTARRSDTDTEVENE
jgi:hypothetical protein